MEVRTMKIEMRIGVRKEGGEDGDWDETGDENVNRDRNENRIG